MKTSQTEILFPLKRGLQAAMFSRDQCHNINKIYDENRRRRIARVASLLPQILTPSTLLCNPEQSKEVQVLFTTWGLPSEFLGPEFFPSLELLLYSGGSVKGFAQPLLERGVQVVGARAANAVPVANFCLAQIILSCKGYFQNAQLCRAPGSTAWYKLFRGPGLYGETVSLLGMGQSRGNWPSGYSNVTCGFWSSILT